MSTKVVITSPMPNHQNVLVTVKDGNGKTVSAYTIEEGTHKEFYVYKGQSLEVSEEEKV